MASRGRKPIVIDQREMQAVVSKCESESSFKNRTELWNAIAATEWARTMQPRPLTAQVAMIKADELGIEIKTPKGLRGRAKGSAPINTGGRKKKVFSAEQRDALISGIPLDQREKLIKTIDRACNGSMKAAVKLKCLDCTNWQKQEVADCTIVDCSLHSFRPYKRPSVIASLDMVEDKKFTPV